MTKLQPTAPRRRIDPLAIGLAALLLAGGGLTVYAYRDNARQAEIKRQVDADMEQHIYAPQRAFRRQLEAEQKAAEARIIEPDRPQYGIVVVPLNR